MEERFLNRFRGLMRAYGLYTIDRKNLTKNKVEGRARTIVGTVTLDLWRRHLRGEDGLGIVPINDEALCSFGAIDVDVYGVDLVEIESKVKNFRLPLVPCRTKSGGVHLYLFTSAPTPASLVRGKLNEWSVLLGFPGVEIFPKQVQLASQDDVGNWINLPYFDAKKSDRYAIKDGKKLSALQFLKYADEIEISAEDLAKIETPSDVLLAGSPPCLQYLAAAGFPEGVRNNGLFNLGVFVRRKYGDEWEKKVDEFNRRYISPPLPTREVATIVKSLRRKTYSYKCGDAPLAGVCNRSICLTREYGVGNDADDPGVAFGGLVKIETAPPQWIVDVDGVRVEIRATADLLAQDRFRVLAVERLNKLPSKVTPKTWETIIQKLLERVEIIAAPEDAGAEGQFVLLLENFCSDRGLARNREEVILGKPWVEGGRVYFRSGDLIKYLDQSRFYEIKSSRDAWTILRKLGATHSQFNIKSKCVRVWSVPEFKSIDGDLEVPRATDRGEDF